MLRHPLRWAALTVTMLLASCTPSHPPANQAEGPVIIEAYRQGIAEAIQEIRNNSPSIYTTTTPTLELDPDTNFPYRPFNGGTTPIQLYRLLGHNDFIRGYVGAPLGPPVPH